MTFLKAKIIGRLLILCILVFLSIKPLKASTNSELAKQWLTETEKEVSAQLKKLSELSTNRLASSNQKSSFFKNAYDICKSQNNQITYLAFEYDTLVFWSNYYPAFEDFLHKICYKQNYIELKNGFYKVVKLPDNNAGKLNWYALIKITNKYILENEFLKNEFVFPLNHLLTGDVHLKKAALQDVPHENISNIDAEPFYVNSKINTTNYKYNTPFYFFMMAFILFILSAVSLSLIKNRRLLYFGLIVIALALLNYFELPNGFFNNSINNPRVFGNADSLVFKSLASAFISSIVLFLFSIYSGKNNNRYLNMLSLVFNTVFIFLFLFNIHANSTIPFNLFEPAHFNIESAMSFIILIIAIAAINYLNVGIPKAKARFWFYTSLTLLIILNLVLLFMMSFIAWMIWTIVFIAFRIFAFSYFENRFFIKHLLIVLMLSFGTSLFIYQNNLEKENNEKAILADNLVFGKDIVAESFFSALKQRMIKDKTLKQLLSQNLINTYALQQHVQQNLLNGYWDKFNIELAIFDSLCFPLTPHREIILDNNSYYDEIIKKEAEPTPDKDFFQLNNTEFQYLSKIKLYNDLPKPKSFTVYLGFKSKEKSTSSGFPDLLLDKKLKLPKALRNYDYAFYKDNALVEVFGNSSFPNRIDNVKNLNHYTIFQKNAGTRILVSNKNIDLKSASTIFSIMMILYFFALVLSLLMQRMILSQTIIEFSLENKFQIVLAIAFTLIFCLIGYLTQNIINGEFRKSNINTLEEKTNSFAIELKNKLGEQSKLDLNFTDYLEYTLQNLSLVFNNDINIYNTNGDLIAASQPQLFNFNIISRKINSDAYYQLLNERNNVIYQDEKIGSLEFLSAYKTIYNNEGKIIAYINVPYFAKQSTLNDALNSFINSILNFYTLLFVLALAGVLLFINYALRPLNIIKEKLSDINLTKHNEQISYNSNDEVGLLVKSYNKMILQLEDKVQQLTQSERDKAWREMARQVAHEIKNPLTPMKLQLQLLQHIKEKATAEELKTQIDKTGTTLIEQIDILARIADEFANFAKIPEAKIESIALAEIINSVMQLYQQDIAIVYDNALQKNTNIEFDKDYAIRILNNLIKNAVQAIPENREGKIKISTFEQEEMVHLIIQDNGIGISKAIKENIFKPYFTTKSIGTGLGLVMVRNMMEHCKGSIDFVSEENEGTMFTLKFMKM